MNIAKASNEFDGSEEHMAAMVARAHNGGDSGRPLSSLKRMIVLIMLSDFWAFKLMQVIGIQCVVQNRLVQPLLNLVVMEKV